MYNLFIFIQKMKNNLSTIASNDLTLKPVLIGMTRMTFRLVLFGLIAILAIYSQAGTTDFLVLNTMEFSERRQILM